MSLVLADVNIAYNKLEIWRKQKDLGLIAAGKKKYTAENRRCK